MKKKLTALEVNHKVMDFLDDMENLDEPEIASEFLLSQVSYLVSTLPKAKQLEFLKGMETTISEVKNGLE